MTIDPSKICFGLTKDIDQQSLATFLRLAGNKDFAQTFSSRLTSDEILTFVDLFMDLMRKHLNEEEYHRLFLGDLEHQHHSHEHNNPRDKE